MGALHAEDGTRISFDEYGTAGSPRAWAVYAHMMPSTKISWRSLATYLADRGIEGVAIDLRGHGSSDKGPEGYTSFTDAEHQASIHDIDAAVRYCTQRGAHERDIFLIGASIGANLSLQYAAIHPSIGGVVALSPGCNYRSVEPLTFVGSLTEKQSILLVSSKDDPQRSTPRAQGNSDEVREIYEAIPGSVRKEILIYENGGHGTNMLVSEEEPQLILKIAHFLDI